MQISKEHFEFLNGKIETLERTLGEERETKLFLAQQVRSFNEILDKIVRAAKGLPIIQSTDGHSIRYGEANRSFEGDFHRCSPPTPEEHFTNELRTFQEQVIFLSDRLAAVTAIAEFAKEHKA